MNLPQRELTDFEKGWKETLLKLKGRFGKAPDLNAVLFLIGIQELQFRQDKNFSKEQKQ